jgi:hypothetical protein
LASANDLNPAISKDFKYIGNSLAVVRSKKTHTRLTVEFVARTQGGNQRKILPVVGARGDTYNSW